MKDTGTNLLNTGAKLQKKEVIYYKVLLEINAILRAKYVAKIRSAKKENL